MVNKYVHNSGNSDDNRETNNYNNEMPSKTIKYSNNFDDEKYRPYFTNKAIIISIQTQDSICVNLGLYMINKIIGFYWELVVSVFRDPINLY